ncbi:MAG TPA: protoporphyrinogen oxidase [Terriglobales bacterium]|nr:protoporphyrinogen oxidase [Terriglobales bacterium]
MVRVAIIGGGISGLTTAFYLEQERRRGAPIEYTLYEAEPRFGGVIRTEKVDGCLIEAGPDSFLTSKSWAKELCDDLRLTQQLIGSNDSERRTYILVGGKLLPIPPGMQMMVPSNLWAAVRSPLFSKRTKLAMLGEYFASPETLPPDEDESVANFVQRHFRGEVVERLVDPLLTGVYGADASMLSVRSTLPQMVESEAKYGSLVRGALIARKKQNRKSGKQPLFTTMRDGMQRIPDVIVRQVPRERLRCSAPVTSLRRSDAAWHVISPVAGDEYDQVVLALPAYACAKLMEEIPDSAPARELLNEIPYSSALTLSLAYKANEIVLPAGFGFLVPRSEGRRMIACTFVNNKFAYRAPEGTGLLRVFMGGVHDPEVLALSDTEAIELARRELREILGIAAEPQFARVFRWPRAMPQYEVGHPLRVARLEMRMQRFPGLQLSGNAYHGIGVPDCVRIGRSAADAVMRRMRAQHAPAL